MTTLKNAFQKAPKIGYRAKVKFARFFVSAASAMH